MKNTTIEKNTFLLEEQINKERYMKNILEEELSNIHKKNMLKELLKEKKTLIDIESNSVIIFTLLSVALLNLLSISTILVIFDNKVLSSILSVFSASTIILYFAFSFSKKTYFGRFFSNIEIRLNKKNNIDKICNKLIVNKRVLSAFKKVYGEEKLKTFMMNNDLITYQDVMQFIKKMEVEQEALDKIKLRNEKERKINEIVSSL